MTTLITTNWITTMASMTRSTLTHMQTFYECFCCAADGAVPH
jgi:hypothetical protein